MSVRNGPNEGNWSVFAEKVVRERDDALERAAIAERIVEELENISSLWKSAGPEAASSGYALSEALAVAKDRVKVKK